jgi:hypothetical protein
LAVARFKVLLFSGCLNVTTSTRLAPSFFANW